MFAATRLIADQYKLVSVAEMKAIEARADAAGHSYRAMMELAGEAVAQAVLQHYGMLRPRVLVLVGPGANGGDGLVCARHLRQAGVTVTAYLWKRRPAWSSPVPSTGPSTVVEPGDEHLAQVVELGILVDHAEEDPDFDTLRSRLTESTLIVDALLGTGANRPIEGRLATLLECAHHARDARPHLDVVAVDCPSGLHCDTGAVDPHTLPANLTVTFAYAKLGHYQFPGVDASGLLQVADIGVYPYAGDDLRTFLLNADTVRPWLPARPRVSHKGAFGKVMVVAGSAWYPGAAALSCAAAGRVGVGLVTGALPRPIWPVVASRLAEPTWLPLPAEDSSEGELTVGGIDESAASTVAQAVAGYDALLLGCGLGQAATTRHFVQQLLQSPNLPPTLIDADGLNALSPLADWPHRLPAQSVLTPHPAELSRLCALPLDEVLPNRWSLARQQAAAWTTVILAKGPYTVIAEPSGGLAVLPIATPALATAGTGDVLAGCVAGLMAQGVAPFAAACLGAWLHGVAGQQCEAEIGPAGVVAGDLLARLPDVMKRLRG